MKIKSDLDYSRLPRYIIIAAAGLALVVFNYFYFNEHTSSNSETINLYSLRDEDMIKTRDPAVAGLFYPAETYQLSSMVDGYLSQSSSPLTSRPHLLISPHAGYVYSAAVAAKAYKRLLPFQNEIKKVIIIGPAHRVSVQGVALSSAQQFKTPLGLLKTDEEITRKLSELPGFRINDAAHAGEHSVEVQLPFLQKVLKKFTIVPLVYGEIDPQALASALEPFLQDNQILIVFSADLSHYFDYQTAQEMDKQTAEKISSEQPLEDHRSCGATGINAALLLAKKYALQPRLMDMANSGDVTGETDSVVGYASWIFNREPPKKVLSPLEKEVENLRYFAKFNGAELMKISRTALKEAVNRRHSRPEREDYRDILFNKGASFVTLHKNGELRGCIGSLLPRRAIALDVAENTYAAAMEDSRFPELTAEELPDIRLSISLLTGFEPIPFTSEQNLLEQIAAGTDGIVIRDGNRQGLFLPSVWKELPDKADFLNQLKLKAGLSPSYWSDQIKVYRFRIVEIKDNDN